MIVKVVVPDSIYARVYFARGEQGPQGATGPQGVQGAQGPTGATGPAGTNGTNGTSYTPGDPIYVTVRNATGSLMTKGTIVYTSGANGTHTQVPKALATGDATSARTLGWLAEDLANNQSGLCMVEGYLDGVNTAGFTEGAQLYLSGTVAGTFTETKPQAPIHLLYVGVTAKASAGNGKVYVKVQNGYELDELHNVLLTSKTEGQVLTYEASSGLWKNKGGSQLAPVTKTAAFTVADTETNLIVNGTASVTVTLPTASSFTGRSITIKTIAAFTVVSASSNVVPLTSATAGTAILAATAGKWATLVSNGTNWVIMAGN